MTGGTHAVVLSDAALAMLDRHMDFLARAGKPAAVKTMEQILADIRSLDRGPARYPFYENEFLPEGRYRKMISARRYLVLYEIAEDAVFVDYIADCRQGGEWIFY